MRVHPALRITAALLLGSSSLFNEIRAEEPAPTKAPTAEEIKAWVAQLGDQEFDKRNAAQSALLKAGLPAMDELKAALNSADPEVKGRAAELLRKIRWTVIPASVNHLTLFSDQSVYLLHFDHIAKTLESAQATAVGKLLKGEDLKPLVDFAHGKIAEGLKQGKGTIVLDLLKKLQGQVTGAVWNFDFMQMGKIRAALIVDLPSDQAQTIYQGFLTDSAIFAGGPTIDMEGLQVLCGPRPAGLPPDFDFPTGAITLAGNHMILGPNVDSVKEVALGLVKPDAGNLAASTLFKKLEPHLGDRHDVLFAMNMQAYLNMMKQMPGVNMGVALGQLGYDGMELFLWNTAIRGDVFEDRYVMATNNKLGAMGKLYELAWASTKPLKEKLGMAPANAIAVAQNYMDGSVVYEFATGYLKSLSNMQEGMGAPPLDLAKPLEQFEANTGLKLSELAACVKGEMVTWAEIAKDDEAQSLPDLGIRIECTDEAKAKQLAEGLYAIMQKAPELFNSPRRAAPPPPPAGDGAKGENPPPAEQPKEEPAKETVKKIERDGRVYYTESSESPFVTGAKARQALPYRLSWSAQGPSLLIASSAPYLNRRISQLEKNVPGLDPAKFVPADLKTDEIKSFFGLDLGELAEFGAKLGLPILAAQLEEQPDLQEKITNLAQKKGVFKSLPPLTIFAGAPKDGVTVSTVRSPIPPVPAAILAGIVFARSQRARPVAPPPPQDPAQPPAPGF